MADINDVLAQVENVDNRRTATVRLLLRQDLARQHADLETELLAAKLGDDAENRPAQAPAIAERIVALEDEIDAAKVTFTFRSIGRRDWVNLIGAHPPTKAQLKAVAESSLDPIKRVSLDFNPDTFPRAAIAASCVDPVMSVEDVARIENAISDAQWSQLWGKAIEANVGGSDPKASKVAGLILRLKEQSATIAAPAVSDALTS